MPASATKALPGEVCFVDKCEQSAVLRELVLRSVWDPDTKRYVAESDGKYRPYCSAHRTVDTPVEELPDRGHNWIKGYELGDEPVQFTPIIPFGGEHEFSPIAIEGFEQPDGPEEGGLEGPNPGGDEGELENLTPQEEIRDLIVASGERDMTPEEIERFDELSRLLREQQNELQKKQQELEQEKARGKRHGRGPRPQGLTPQDRMRAGEHHFEIGDPGTEMFTTADLAADGTIRMRFAFGTVDVKWVRASDGGLDLPLSESLLPLQMVAMNIDAAAEWAQKVLTSRALVEFYEDEEQGGEGA